MYFMAFYQTLLYGLKMCTFWNHLLSIKTNTKREGFYTFLLVTYEYKKWHRSNPWFIVRGEAVPILKSYDTLILQKRTAIFQAILSSNSSFKQACLFYLFPTAFLCTIHKYIIFPEYIIYFHICHKLLCTLFLFCIRCSFIWFLAVLIHYTLISYHFIF